MNSDVSLKFKNRFKEVSHAAREMGQCQLKGFLKSLQLEGLTPEQKGVILFKEFNRVSPHLVAFGKKEYLYLADDEVNLYKLFSTQLVFRHQQEAIHFFVIQLRQIVYTIVRVTIFNQNLQWIMSSIKGGKEKRKKHQRITRISNPGDSC